MREKLAQHRTNPTCAACHQLMDPLGLALENYDPIGRWRTTDGHEPIDVSATMPDGKSFQGAQGLKEVLRSQEGDFRRCLVEKMLTYALGRGLDYRDTRAVDRICDEVARNQDRFSSMIAAIAASDCFRGAEDVSNPSVTSSGGGTQPPPPAGAVPSPVAAARSPRGHPSFAPPRFTGRPSRTRRSSRCSQPSPTP